MPNIKVRRLRIKKGIRKKLEGTSARPRLSVFKSNKAIYAQVIDDAKGHTLLATSSKDLDKKGGVTLSISKTVGQKLAEKALASGIKDIVFDRNGYLYHGNIKALAEGAREGGLNF
ncbi:MAG: 50S ribosomal protein L18 [Cytophagales bacterium]|jgi:large subunit ribosomal protein L18|nr:50S ribosomal protein L18 [Cytophagales bacterium]MCX8490995.1 50S ribosomal protein L18 [Cyclobacteriaceae bacterium]MCA6366697.1 50S ribosomal protein L18 [Cytophagales bacterium]MCA6372710.1 50S ribosomal protein L18 [Cytophagales bacterium]MCA6377566.1 50S ribosomal protein L18 [Cytophagales bacterium]